MITSWLVISHCLTHLSLNKMATIMQMTFSSTFSWMKMLEFSLKNSSILVPRVPINLSALVQVMAWRPTGDEPLPKPMLTSSPTYICSTRMRSVNTLRQEPNGRHVVDNTFKCIFKWEISHFKKNSLRCFLRICSANVFKGSAAKSTSLIITCAIRQQAITWPILTKQLPKYIMMSSNRNIFRIAIPLCGESTHHRWIPLTRGQWHEPLMFLFCHPERTVEQTLTDTMTVVWHRGDEQILFQWDTNMHWIMHFMPSGEVNNLLNSLKAMGSQHHADNW